ncbi:MAG: methyltransferase domain-containing protein [Bdellovibrionales bacterium]|nr:methyltransferase domain-containing protein [Bdellovibrionales bacterium]
MTTREDKVFSDEESGSETFRFGPKVAACFDNMVERSIPLYWELQRAAVTLALRHAQPDTAIYDVGCSTGTTLVSLALGCPFKSTRIVGTDYSPDMLERCRAKLEMSGCSDRVELTNSAVEETTFERASVVMMNYTLQFSNPDSRSATVRRVFDALVPGGIFILAEKLKFEDKNTAALMETLYYDFKRRNGYSETEIEQKKRALDGFLVPFTRKQNEELLFGAGFTQVTQILQGYPFSVFLAQKS